MSRNHHRGRPANRSSLGSRVCPRGRAGSARRALAGLMLLELAFGLLRAPLELGEACLEPGAARCGLRELLAPTLACERPAASDARARLRGAARGRRLEPHEASELPQRRVDGVAARLDLVEGRDELLRVGARVVGLRQLAAGRADRRVVALEVGAQPLEGRRPSARAGRRTRRPRAPRSAPASPSRRRRRRRRRRPPGLPPAPRPPPARGRARARHRRRARSAASASTRCTTPRR